MPRRRAKALTPMQRELLRQLRQTEGAYLHPPSARHRGWWFDYPGAPIGVGCWVLQSRTVQPLIERGLLQERCTPRRPCVWVITEKGRESR